MKSKIIAAALFAATAGLVVLYPFDQGNATTSIQTPVTITPASPQSNEAARIEVVFVLDTTSSMGGLIEAAKEKIWSIATTLASSQQAPEIRMGLVAFRDRGDAYVTRVVDLSPDLDTMYAMLMDFHAVGGGDGPESVNQALYDAIHKVSWSQDNDTYRVVFLVGDAPPHMDYVDDVKYYRTLSNADSMGIVVNAIQCGDNAGTAAQWQQIAQLGGGRYFQVGQAGSAVAIATPYDGLLAAISRKLDDTRLYYGTEEERAVQERKMKAKDKLHASSSLASRARRAAFNATASGRTNLLGDGELVQDMLAGRVDLSTIDADQLPGALQARSPAEQKKIIDDTAKRRDELQREIRELTDKRSAFIKKEIDSTGGAKESLDEKIYSAVREQAAKVGLEYADESSAY
jgi:uncharacterized protein YegL